VDLRLLKIFKSVAQEKGMAKAAKKLNYVQSNITARIHDLEDALETQLFYRKKRGVELTPAGKMLLIYTDKILQLTKEAQKAVRETHRGVQGPLSIGAKQSVAAVRLPSALARYRLAYPLVDLELTTDSTGKLVTKVLEYELDGALVSGRIDHDQIDQEEIFPEELVLVTARQVNCIAEIRDPVLIVCPEGCTHRAVLENWVREKGIIPQKILKFEGLEAILGCVAAGMGITLLPRSAIEKLNHFENLNTHDIDPKVRQLPTTFIRRKDTIVTKALEAFLQILRKEGH
jgi:DNA-binding transcriptional LysR family regulator